MEVKPVHLHLLLQIRPAIEQQGQKAFLDMSSCLPLLPEHLWVEVTVCRARQRSMKSTRALTSLSLLPEQPADPDLGAGLPKLLLASSAHKAASGKKHIPNWEEAPSALISQHCGEFAAAEGRITGRSLSCLCKACARQQQVITLLWW